MCSAFYGGWKRGTLLAVAADRRAAVDMDRLLLTRSAAIDRYRLIDLIIKMRGHYSVKSGQVFKIL